MGLPDISISFSSLASTAIQRSQRGIVALILKDDTGAFSEKVYGTVDEVQSADWTPENYQYIKDTFLGAPLKVIVERLDTTATDYSAALATLANRIWNYLAVPGIVSADVSTISDWIISERTSGKTFKGVLPSSASDSEGVINFTTEGIVVGANTYTASDYTARIAGILAGLPLTRSVTYYELTEVDSITESATPDDDIDAGQLILINGGDKIKIARGVNSLQTTTPDKGDDWKKIKIIEGHDLVHDDITNTFDDSYVGQVNNDYDNQAIFVATVNAYLKKIQGDVLDPNSTNNVGIDISAQRNAWEDSGTDTSTWSDQKVKETAFGSKVFLQGTLKFVDAMEDLSMVITA